jgi:hypothetical protein
VIVATPAVSESFAIGRTVVVVADSVRPDVVTAV